MPADVQIRRWFGGTRNTPDSKLVVNNAGTVTNIRACAFESSNPGDTYPIQIPNPGSFSYSYWITTRLYCNSVGPAHQLSNFYWYTTSASGAFGTGVYCIGQDATGYYPAQGTPSVTGIPLTQANYGGATYGGTTLLTAEVLYPIPDGVSRYNANNNKSLGSGLIYGSDKFAANPIDHDSTIGNLFVCQIVVDGTATPGTTPNPVSFFYKYDEQ